MAKSRTPCLDDKEALARLLSDMSRMWPRLEYLKEKTTHKEIKDGKQPPRVLTTYYFAASRFFVGSPQMLCFPVSFRALALNPEPSSWGTGPPGSLAQDVVGTHKESGRAS